MQNRIIQLRTQINHHNHCYHVLNHPEISDQQFDEMFEKLIELEKQYPEFADPNSPTQRVGSDLTHNLPRLPHPSPMRSIQSFYESDKLLRNLTSGHDSASEAKQPANFHISPKYDGIAIELLYSPSGEDKGGLSLSRALTRGNGNTGGNVTPNARTIKQIPLTLPGAADSDPLILRGEVFVTHKELTRLNRARKKEKKQPYPNCRSAAASILKAKKSSTAAAANLSVVFFFVEYVQDSATPSNRGKQPHVSTQLALLQKFHLPTPETRTAATPAEALQIAAEIAATQYKFPTDGAVIKAENPEQYGSASVAKQPGTWAYKPNNPVWETTCRFVSWKVGKTGKVTPLAHFVPFKHNGTEFHKAVITPQLAQQLRPRHTIHVQITGGIIPKVIFPSGHDSASEAKQPQSCPLCHLPLTKNRCQNTKYCPAFGNTAETVKQHTGWPYEFQVFKDFDGNGIYIAAIQGENAMVVQREPHKHDMVLITDTLDTAARVGVRIGELDKGPFNFESNF